MKYRATEKFKKLGIDNSYQGLHTNDYEALKRGEEIELKEVFEWLILENYLEEVKEKIKEKEVRK